MRLTVLSLPLIALVAATPAIASAQISTGKSAVLSIQPIDAMLTVYAGEAEMALSRSVTLGVGGTY